MTKKEETALLFIWTVALIATLGSLYYSELLGYVPCDLCWVQRILMYPSVIIYGIALLKRNLSITYPALLLSMVGLPISIYHDSLQRFSFLSEAGGMCTNVPCKSQYSQRCGVTTVP